MILFFNKCCDATWNLPWFFANCIKRLETGAWHYFKSALLSVKHDCFILQKTYGLDSENCSEISAVTPLGICLKILTFPTFVFFTPPFWPYPSSWSCGQCGGGPGQGEEPQGGRCEDFEDVFQHGEDQKRDNKPSMQHLDK